MAAYSPRPDGAPASITVFPSMRLNKINRNIYSGFTEHMGRCIYGGIYDPSNANKDLIDSNGFRLDVIEALKPLGIPCFRYPGGNFCATYHWLDGVGPRESRPAHPELAWGAVETNHFGTDEFMLWCEAVHAEPYLCFNFGTGTLDEALAWLEYCNGTKNTYYANMRRRNGHEEPYNVKYWALGNEMWGDWQIGQMTAEDYAQKALQWAKALKLLDSTIELVLCGREGPNEWDVKVLKHCLRSRGIDELGEMRVPLIDMHSIHWYTASDEHYKNVTGPLAGERAISCIDSYIDLCYYENKIPATQKRPKVCFDEWNVWLPKRAPGSLGAEEDYTLSDALAVGVWLNLFVRKSDVVAMANIAQSVNVLSPLMTKRDGLGIIKQSTWWPYELFCKYMKGERIAVNLACDEYQGSTKPDFIRSGHHTPYLDISASIDEENMVSVCVVNIHLERDYEIDVGGVDGKVQVFTVGAHGEDIHATNMHGDPTAIVLKEDKWDGKGNFTFKKHSLTMLRWKVKLESDSAVVLSTPVKDTVHEKVVFDASEWHIGVEAGPARVK